MTTSLELLSPAGSADIGIAATRIWQKTMAIKLTILIIYKMVYLFDSHALPPF